MTKEVTPRRCRGVCVERLTNGLGAWHKRHYNAFTLIELIVVVGIILVLAALVLSTAGYARKKSARARAETEIAAMSAACESYKADNGIYPRGNADLSPGTPPYDTDKLDARRNGNPDSTPSPDPAAPFPYSQTSLYLYKQLSGDLNGNRQIDAGETGKSYFAFKPNMLLPAGGTGTVTAIADPFGHSYGYSTANQYDPNRPEGYNPTFDLWSTSGLTTDPPVSDTDTITPQWIKNW